MRIDLNADVGESFGVYSLGDDHAVMRSVSSASVAAGFHGGDPTVLRRTIAARANPRRGGRAHTRRFRTFLVLAAAR
jgi:UPF0271 protein